MSIAVDHVAWPLARLGEAIDVLASRSGLGMRGAESPTPPPAVADDPDALTRFIEHTASWLGLEAEAVESTHAGLETMIQGCGPAILRLPGDSLAFTVVLGRRGRHLRAIGPDLEVHKLAVADLCHALRAPLESRLAPEIDAMLDGARVPARRRARVRAAILRERTSEAMIGGCFILRLDPGASPWKLVGRTGLPGRLALLVSAHTAEYLLWLLSWVMVGRAALQGHFDQGWLLAWALVLVSLVPLRMLVRWTQGVVAIRAGGLLKQRLLQGALRLGPDKLRRDGSGQLMGRVIESERVESMALSGGFGALLSTIELLVAAVVVAMGAGGAIQLTALVLWVAITIGLAMRLGRLRSDWTRSRVSMTNDLVEAMIGHRTRLAQQGRERLHEGEDQTMEQYLARSRALDNVAATLLALIPRGWLVVGLATLAPGFVTGSASIVELAVGIGGILLAYAALHGLAVGLNDVLGARIAWDQVRPLFTAAAETELVGTPTVLPTTHGEDGPASVLDAHDLVFRYDDRGEPVLRSCSLAIARGDRVLLEGASGSGKTTLASVLVGLRRPQSGLVLLHGLDRHTLGTTNWHRKVVAAPQFHENHVLTETFAFNLLMGRRWPPEPGDMEEADEVCRELGLGELIDRMPGGLLQMVGDTGWQLSHGERSRLFMARALLQKPELIIFDESFASLDPENLQRALACTLDRARTVMVIAHP